MTARFEVYYASHLDPDGYQVQAFESEDEAEARLFEILRNVQPFEQVNYWVRDIKDEQKH